MSKSVTVAFCTNFSEASKVSIDTFIFNYWSFAFHIDIIHLVEDDNPNEALKKLYNLQDELRNTLSEEQKVNVYMFDKGEINMLTSFINEKGYIQVICGITGTRKSVGIGSFAHNLYKRVNIDIAFIPAKHNVKIENRGMIGLEYKNLDSLYVTYKYQQYYDFSYTKMEILLVTDELLTPDELEVARERMAKIFLKLNFDIINYKKGNNSENLLEKLKTTDNDFLIFFKNDYFDHFILESFENGILDDQIGFTFFKYFVSDSLVQYIKMGGSKYRNVQLK